MVTNKPRAQGKTSTGRAETYLHRKFQTYKKNPTFPIYEKIINRLATVYKEPVSVVERDLPNQALTKEQYAIYKSIVAHGFLPFEALILASGDRSITQINTPVWQRSLKDRRREIRKLKAQGLNDQQIRIKIINWYLKNPKRSPWDFIRIECSPKDFDFEREAHETLAFKKAVLAAARVDAKKKAKRKCDSCDESAINFSSPLGNPDEPALCDECFKKMNEQMHEKAGGKR